MRTDWLLFFTHRLGSDAVQSFFVRVVELSVTYLVQSTLFLSAAWLLLRLISRRSRSKPLDPLTIEKTWKLAAILPLITAPICVSTGWSTAIVKLPFADARHGMQQQERGTIDMGDRSGRTTLTGTEESDFELSQANLSKLDGPFLTESDLEAMLRFSQEENDPLNALAVPRNQPNPDEFPSELNARSNLLRTAALKPLHANDVTDSLAIAPITAVAKFGMVLLLWMAGCLARLIWKGVWLEIWLCRCTPIESKISRMLFGSMPEACRIRMLRSNSETAPPPRGRSEQNLQPFACGLFRWTIVMPDGIEDRLSSDECRALLTHEVAHLVRRDPAWQWLGQILCTCLAFQPINFVARRQWLRASELLSDDWAIDHRVTPTSLARCLTKIAEWQLDQKRSSRPITSLGLFAIGQGGSLTSRVEWLLRPRHADKPTRMLLRAITTSAAITTGLLVGMHGPRLVIAAPTQTISPAISFSPDATTAGDAVELTLKSELSAANEELVHLQSQLSRLSEPEIDAVADDLLLRIQELQKQLEK